jgi:hypothetical protein
MMNDGAQIQIEGAAATTEAYFRTYFIRPGKEALKGIEVSSEGEKTILKHENKGVSSVQVYSGNTRTTKTWTPQAEYETTDQFTLLKGKLAPAKTTTRIHQGQDTSVATTTMHYQDLWKIMFPSALEQHTQISSPSVKQEVDIKITFSGCKVE